MTKNHVGRPSNFELRAKKNKLILTTGIVMVSIFAFVGVLEFENFDILKGDSSSNSTEFFYGDVNLDGNVNIQDKTLLTRYVSGLYDYNLSDTQVALADLNKDGIINQIDLSILDRYLENGITNLPYKK